MLRGIGILTALVLVSGCVISIASNSSSADVKLNKSLEISAEDLSKFVVETSTGDINIVGVAGQTVIKVEARIRTTKAQDYEFSLTKKGTTARLVAGHESHNFSWTSAPYIDLEVTMPTTLALEVNQRSGDMSIKNIQQEVTVSDTSGDLRIQDIQGVLNVDDRSGDLNIKNIGSSIVVVDTSGDVLINDVTGNVTIDDRSGDINVYNVSGDVEVSDRSGDINVRGAESLNIIDDASGDVSHSNIRSYIHMVK